MCLNKYSFPKHKCLSPCCRLMSPLAPDPVPPPERGQPQLFFHEVNGQVLFLFTIYWKGPAVYNNRIKNKRRRGKLWFSDLPSPRRTKQVLVPWRYIFYRRLGLERRLAPQTASKPDVSAEGLVSHCVKKNLEESACSPVFQALLGKESSLEPTPHWQESWPLC